MGTERSEAVRNLDGLCGGPDESLFRSHFENLPGPAYIWRRSGDDFRLIAYNKAANELAYSKASNFVGASALELQRERGVFVPLLHRCVERAAVLTEELEYRYQPGAVRRLIVTLIPVAPDIVVQHTEDITDRHAAHQALRESEARSRALMEANPDMLMRVSRDGHYLDVHIPDKLKSRLPFRSEQFLGRNVEELFEPEFARAHARYRKRALDTGEMQLWQYIRIVDGQTRYIDARFVRSGDDEVVIAVTDVTGRVDLEREIVNSVERERIHIGHDLHDGLGQLLTGIKLMLEPLKKKLTAGSGEDGKSLGQAIDLINHAIAHTSRLARGLSPVPRDGGFTLAHALEQLAKRSEDFFDVTCGFTHSGVPADLSEACANNLYRIAQEAITNAVKHGKASNIRLHCRCEDGRLLLTIEDNGLGISEPRLNPRGMGLHIMQYRARVIGGEATLSCRPEGGMIVSCSCPLPEGRSAAASRR